MDSGPSSWHAGDVDPSILQTCSQIYNVGTNLLYSSNRIEFFSANALYRFTGGINQLVWNSHWITRLDLTIKVFEPYEIEQWKELFCSGYLSQFYPALKKLGIDLPDNKPGRNIMPIRATTYPDYMQTCDILAAYVRAPVVRFLDPGYNEDGIDGKRFAKDMERMMSTDIRALEAEYAKEEQARQAGGKGWGELQGIGIEGVP
ncbi:MAG: hypothetical protein Q9187_002445 [Circinaria calcarea]